MEFVFDHTPLRPTQVDPLYDEDDPFAPDNAHNSPDNPYEDDDVDPLEDDSVFGFTGDNVQPQTAQTGVLSRLHLSNALHMVSQNEMTTYSSLLASDPRAEVFVGPTHEIDTTGNLGGFRLVVDAQRDCVNLPMTRNMFKGSTCVECDPGGCDIHPDVIRLLSDPAAVRASILKVLAEIHAHEPDTLVSLDHMPVAVDTEVPTLTLDDHYTGRERSDILLENLIAERIGRFSSTMRGRDSRVWECDMPSSIGVYHARRNGIGVGGVRRDVVAQENEHAKSLPDNQALRRRTPAERSDDERSIRIRRKLHDTSLHNRHDPERYLAYR
ncbi:hypothetical protein T484DRAFT_1753441 [Baffinella frigidus]|nr:hypothetical protein T484DRAFT_1753441 [Cryptophyta sp. CCMP2293]